MKTTGRSSAGTSALADRLRARFGARVALSLNPAGLGDSAVAVYAASALARHGLEVTLHTPQARWLSRVRQPGLEITDHPPPADATALYRDYDGHVRYAESRAYWMSGAIDIELLPCRPAAIDQSVLCDRLGDGRRRFARRCLARCRLRAVVAHVARHALLELLCFEGFYEIVDGAVAHRGDGLINRAVGRHQ